MLKAELDHPEQRKGFSLSEVLGKGSWGRRSCQAILGRGCGSLSRLPAKHPVTWAGHPAFLESGFSMRDAGLCRACRGVLGKGRGSPEGPVTPEGTWVPWLRLQQGTQDPAPLPSDPGAGNTVKGPPS